MFGCFKRFVHRPIHQGLLNSLNKPSFFSGSRNKLLQRKRVLRRRVVSKQKKWMGKNVLRRPEHLRGRMVGRQEEWHRNDAIR